MTSELKPLQPVAENSHVLQQQIEGQIERDGKGFFVAVAVEKPEENKQENSK